LLVLNVSGQVAGELLRDQFSKVVGLEMDDIFMILVVGVRWGSIHLKTNLIMLSSFPILNIDWFDLTI